MIQSLFTTSGAQLFFRDTQLRLLAKRDDVELSGKPLCEVERSGIGRIELRGALLAGLGTEKSPVVSWGKTFQAYTKLSNGRVRAEFTDGTSEEGDLLVGADGANSEVRQHYLPTIQRLDLGILAIAGRTLVNKRLENELPPALTDGSLNNIVPHGKGWMFVSAWKSRASSDHSSVAEHYVLWAYVLRKRDAPREGLELSGPELLGMVLKGIEGWAPELQTLVREADLSTIKCLNIRSMPNLLSWSPSNVTVLGDSIHNMTPMAGIGANTALRDAEVLTRVLIDASSGRMPLVEAIGIYEQEMRTYANSAVGTSRRNAESACSGGGLQRVLLRGLLHVAQASPKVMRATFGRAAVE